MTHDPYAAPTASNLASTEAPLDLHWRGAIWFVVPVFALFMGLDAWDYYEDGSLGSKFFRELFEKMISVWLPAAVAGYASGCRCRSTSWLRYLVLAARDGLVWAIYVMALLWWISRNDPGPVEFAAIAKSFAFVATITCTLVLLFATSMRFYYRRRP